MNAALRSAALAAFSVRSAAGCRPYFLFLLFLKLLNFDLVVPQNADKVARILFRSNDCVARWERRKE